MSIKTPVTVDKDGLVYIKQNSDFCDRIAVILGWETLDGLQRRRTKEETINIAKEIQTALNERAALREALEAGVAARNAQKAYFKSRTQEALIHSKQCEKSFDDLAKAALAKEGA